MIYIEKLNRKMISGVCSEKPEDPPTPPPPPHEPVPRPIGR